MLSRPARNYPRFWIQRPSSERRRDLNPPDSCAAQRTIRPQLTSALRSDRLTAPSVAEATQSRSPGVSSIAFGAQPPDLRFASLMDLDFAMCRPLVRRLRLISGFCSSARTFDPRFLQTPPRDGSPCVSLTLHLHQVGWKTFTSELLSMPGTRLNRSRGRALRRAAWPCQQWMERWEPLT